MARVRKPKPWNGGLMQCSMYTKAPVIWFGHIPLDQRDVVSLTKWLTRAAAWQRAAAREKGE